MFMYDSRRDSVNSKVLTAEESFQPVMFPEDMYKSKFVRSALIF